MTDLLGEVPPEAFLEGPPDGDLVLQRTLRQIRAETAAERRRTAAAAPRRGRRRGRARARAAASRRRPGDRAGAGRRGLAAPREGGVTLRGDGPSRGHDGGDRLPGRGLGAGLDDRARHPGGRALPAGRAGAQRQQGARGSGSRRPRARPRARSSTERRSSRRTRSRASRWRTRRARSSSSCGHDLRFRPGISTYGRTVKPLDPRLLRTTRAVRVHLAVTVACGAALTGLILLQAWLVAHAVAHAPRSTAGRVAGPTSAASSRWSAWSRSPAPRWPTAPRPPPCAAPPR